MQKASESVQFNTVESQEKVILVFYNVDEELVEIQSLFVILDIFQEKVVKLKKQLTEFVEERRGWVSISAKNF